ncbi:MAG: lipoyl-dependent peroxiredoxin [Solirubrobacteraceae bacterium]|jgi:osmotically inducible protein OsmC|nr:lipoyl-dependent peroxiredoxin [Solirubrobacteraceae bacterium]
MAAERTASTVWEGDLAHGAGVTTPASGAFGPVDVTWASRTERSAGKTSPEELLAAAHASCYCMQLSHELAEAGTPPERLEATATVTLVVGEGVTTSRIVVTGVVAGIDQDAFAAAAESAGEGCPISGALTGNVEITVEATLAT